MNILNSDLSGICLLRTYDRKNLIIEQAAVIDGGKVFLQATYKLESDARLIFTAYSMSQELATAASQQHCQNMRDEAEKLGKTLQKLLLSRSMEKTNYKQVSLSSCRSSMFSLAMLSVLSRLRD